MGLNFADSVTAGIISSPTRVMPVASLKDPQQVLDYQPVIQTDAAINPGNSGGPLIDDQGTVIGIVSSKITAPNFDSMGFAIPANVVHKIASCAIQHDDVVKLLGRILPLGCLIHWGTRMLGTTRNAHCVPA